MAKIFSKLLTAIALAGFASLPTQAATYRFQHYVPGLSAAAAINYRISACSVTTSNDRFGPTSSECQASYAEYPSFTDPSVFSIGTTASNKGYQYWKVPVSGQYTFTLAGAQGGDGHAYGVFNRGGYGAVVKTTLLLQKGTVLIFVIGKQPVTSNIALAYGLSAGGGGGSFIYSGTTLLLAAGGGGGGATTPGEDASLTTPGASASGGSSNGSYGAGGAGVNGNGTSIAGAASGGLSFISGFSGGATLDSAYGRGEGHGGFGGGGGACACSTGNGGNGGGYGGGSGTPFLAALYHYGGGAAGTSYLGSAGAFIGIQNSGSGWADISKL